MAAISKKICMLGEFGVGKTSLVRRFVHERFDDKYVSTVGVKVSRKTIVIARNSEIINLTMMLWDLAGSEEFNSVRASYLRGTAGAILVCDVTRPETLPKLLPYVEDLQTLDLSVPLVMAANKVDLDPPSVDEEQVAAFAQQLACPYFLTSAKSGDEVEALFRQLGFQMVSNDGQSAGR